ncbi:hypothetical protein B0I37DRAFT_201563 [Chaetomium sp. MPI-CAGE-AT-0009]|nr:hypothetical protein B0I37DRAFT_201563 [Chaetomium sp. MPI-CAGE-AT-0009]
MMPGTSSETKGGGPALTRRNLKAFTVKTKKETARRRGRSTPSASPDFHSYCETMSSDLPPPSQRLQLSRPRPTAAEIAADYPEWQKRVNENLPMIRPETPPFPLYSPEPESPAHSIDDKNEHGPTGQINSPLQAPATVPDSGMVDDAVSKAASHSGPAGLIVPGMDDGATPAQDEDGDRGAQYADEYAEQYDNGYPVQYDNGYPPGQYDWSYAPPQPGLPTERPTIPRQQPIVDAPSNSGPRFPANFPAYHATQNMNEIAAYLANASYVVSLGGTPLADLKYGIIIVPAGEESLLFSPPPQSVIDQDFVDAIDDANRNYDRALRMHDPDKDIEEFVRHRFDDDFASVSAGAQQNVETTLANEEGGAGEHDIEDDASATAGVEEPQPKRPRRGPQRKSPPVAVDGTASSCQDATSPGKAERNVKRGVPAVATLNPQETAKTRRSPRVVKRGFRGKT